MPEPQPPYRGRGSLTRRILAVNVVALALLGGSLFYLDNFRARLVEERRAQAENGAQIMAAAIAAAPRRSRPKLIATLGRRSGDRLRVFGGRSNRLLLDSWRDEKPTFTLDEIPDEPWDTAAGRRIDWLVDNIVGARVPPPFVDRGDDARNWPELMTVKGGSTVASRVRLAPDRTLIISAATPVDIDRSLYVLAVNNARDVTRLVREERLRLARIVSVTTIVSILLSLFLARTIVVPLRRLALAAFRVRLGRAREVVVPRLPSRSDEIGMLARAVSDMSQALRQRIDAIDAFAADVAHELKNPLASLGSAVESLGRTTDPDDQRQLHAIIADDVRRLDRLITDIAELSRLDAQLTRADFVTVDLGAMVAKLVDGFVLRRDDGDCALTYRGPAGAPLLVVGDEARLARAVGNVIDNALSFSPTGTTVRVAAERDGQNAGLTIQDEGPGIPPDQREVIFRRFHSDRPDAPADARHSGLGLAIARTIVDGHGGTIEVGESRPGQGAQFVIRLPIA